MRLAVIFVSWILVTSAHADTLILKSGERVKGYYEGGTARTIKFRAEQGGAKDYDILAVSQLIIGDESATPAAAAPRLAVPTAPAPAAAAPAPAAPPSAERPVLRAAAERERDTTASAASNRSITISTGTKIVVRMIDPVDSEKQKTGDRFLAQLDEPISLNGEVVVPKGVDVRGRLSSAEGAGRVAGSAELGLELIEIMVNGVPYSLQTSEYSEVGEGRGGETARRAAAGAGVGAIIGAIAGGAKGAAVGAGVGAGGATAVQVLTKGEKVRVPSETRLEFTLRAPLVVAAR